MMVHVTVNGRAISEDVAPDMRLYDFLRAHGIKSIKCGCETSNCGLCTVWMDKHIVLSCSVVMGRADGHTFTTLEALREESAEFARCMAEEGAEQCGFCSPGFIMSVMALKRFYPNADDEQIGRYLAGNLCRCTGYASQLRAVRRFLGRTPELEQAGGAGESGLALDKNAGTSSSAESPSISSGDTAGNSSMMNYPASFTTSAHEEANS